MSWKKYCLIKSVNRPIGIKEMLPFMTLKMSRDLKYSLQNLVFTVTPCATYCSFQRRWFSLEDTCISSTQLNRRVSSQQSICPPWNTYSSEKSSFQKTTSILTGNQVLLAPATQTNGFLSRDTCISSTQLDRLIWIKMSFSPSWKLWFSGSIPFKHYFNSHSVRMC